MIRNSYMHDEVNTITLSNRHLCSIKSCIEAGIKEVDKEIKKAEKQGMSECVISTFESMKNHYLGIYYALNEIAHETKTEFNLDKMLEGFKNM